MVWGFCRGGINCIHTLLHIKQTVNTALLDSAGNSTQHSAMTCMRAALMAQWIRTGLPVQGTQVCSLIGEDPTRPGAQLLKPVHLEPRALQQKSTREKPVHPHGGHPPAHCNQRKAACSDRDPAQPEINKYC